MSKFSKFDSVMTQVEADRYARGSYQQAILDGVEAYSGSTLKGRAKKWAPKYRRSADTLIDRLASAGFVVRFEKGPHNRKVLSVSRPRTAQHVSRGGGVLARWLTAGKDNRLSVRCLRHRSSRVFHPQKGVCIKEARIGTKRAGLEHDLAPLALIRTVRRNNGKA